MLETLTMAALAGWALLVLGLCLVCSCLLLFYLILKESRIRR